MDKADGPWTLPEDLATLHNVVIHYGVHVQKASAAQHEKTGNGPLSHMALSHLHRIAIVNHRATRALCEAGWTPTTPTMIRTLLDILVSAYAVASKPENSEYMGFKYLAHSFIEAIFNPDSAPELVNSDTGEVDKVRNQLQPSDLKRADDLIATYKVKTPPYWYWPEFPNPGSVIKQKMARNSDLWHFFCGSTHGALIGSLMFSDFPDDAGIDPEENPRKTRSAIVSSSRLLLDISFARGQFEGVADLREYTEIVRKYILPQQGIIENRVTEAPMEPNPKGTVFVELIAELMDLLKNPNVSRIEVVMANYELDGNGQRKVDGGKEAIAIRPFIVRGMDKEVEDELRKELDSGPITLLMILWIDRTKAGVPLGMFFFDPAGKKRTAGIDGMDHLEKSVMADYLNRQVKN